jgi:hypothetical protein
MGSTSGVPSEDAHATKAANELCIDIKVNLS